MREKIYIVIFSIIFILSITGVIFFNIYGKNIHIDKRIDKKLYEYGLIEK